MKLGDTFTCFIDGRKQSYAPDGVSGGITEHEAQELGWVPTTDGRWLCPICSGNEDKLRRVFNN